ncbi:MAG: sensor histidine kinase [Candidatus Methylomirabilales bacterium]
MGVALVLGTGLTYLVEKKMLERATLASLDYFKNVARFIITGEEFVKVRTGEEYEAFDRLIRENFLTSNVVAIKIYDRSGTIIYHSRKPQLVGRSFPGNVPLRKALGGESVVGLSDLRGSEHFAERQAGHSRLFEVYIPIFLEGTRTVIGAYEIYSPIDPLYQRVWTLRLTVWGAILFGLALLYVALWLTFRRASKTIVQQNLALERTAEELREAYDGLKQTQFQLVQSERLASAGRFAAGIVHEVGNPLGSIVGLLDLQVLCRGRPEDRSECRERSERIAGEITRLKRILQGLLDYARPSPPQLAPVEVNEVVEKTLGLVTTQKGFERIVWIKELDPSPPRAVADEFLLQQILLNLLLNAAQAMAERGPILVGTGAGLARQWVDGDYRLGRAFSPAQEVVSVSIADRGPGIPSDHLERIFEPFFSTKGRGQGSGLGLAICHSLIEAVHGALVVKSQLGVGTTIRVLLPLAEVAPQVEPVTSEKAGGA